MEPGILCAILVVGGAVGLKGMENWLGRTKVKQIANQKEPELPAKMTSHAIRHEEKMNFPDWPEEWYTPCNCHICVPRTEGLKIQPGAITGESIVALSFPQEVKALPIAPPTPKPKIKKSTPVAPKLEQIGRRLIIRGGTYRYEPVYGYRTYNANRMLIEIADETGRIVKVIKEDEGLRTR